MNKIMRRKRKKIMDSMHLFRMILDLGELPSLNSLSLSLNTEFQTSFCRKSKKVQLMKTTTLGVIRMIDSKLYILTLISVTSLIRPFSKRCFDLSN